MGDGPWPVDVRRYAPMTDAAARVIGETWRREVEMPGAAVLVLYTDVLGQPSEAFIPAEDRSDS